MKQQTMRILDHRVGRWLCLLLTFHRRIFDFFSAKKELPPIQKILFIKLIEQGTSVLAYGALQRAISLVGKENVYFLVFQENRAILDIMQILPSENICSIRSDNILKMSWDLLRALRFFRSRNIDSVINMEFFSRCSAIITYLTGAKRRVGLHRFKSEGPYTGDLMTHRVQHNPYLHVSKSYQLLAESLIHSPDEIPLAKINMPSIHTKLPLFIPTAEDTSQVSALLQKLLPIESKQFIILLNPNAGDLMPLRKWPAERFVQLAEKLITLHEDLIILLTGTSSESEAVNEIAQTIIEKTGSNRIASVAGKTSLRDLLVLYTMSDILVTNDSGPGHFASMTPIKTVVLFGPETPVLFSPLGHHIKSFSAGLACSPCINVMNNRHSSCKNNICMQAITVENVLGMVLEFVPRSFPH